jgi:NCAIR mutase (PurE)-related protein
MDDPLDDILSQIHSGELDVAQGKQLVRQAQAQSLGFATLDHDRKHRCGVGEVVYAVGKEPHQVVAITKSLLERDSHVLITRASDAHVTALQKDLPDLPMEVSHPGSTILVGKPKSLKVPPIAIVTAGTSDQAVAGEAALTCKAMGHPSALINDVGVAGVHRLARRIEQIRQANVVICIAGMEGALPSVIGGLVNVPVIAVPTSVGYGANFGGVSALLGMLTSCAAGVVVVNIDNGFGAAYAACLINRQAARVSGIDDE